MEENSQDHIPSAELEPSKLPHKSRMYLYAALAVVIIAGLVYGIQQSKHKSAKEGTTVVSETGAKKDIKLTEEEKKVLEAQINNYGAQIKNLTAETALKDKSDLYLKLASAQYKLGQYEAAISSLDKIAGEDPDNHRMWTLYTNIYWDMENYPKARESSQRAIDTDKDNPQSWLAFIELQEDQGKDFINGLYQEALKRTDLDITVVTAYAKFLEKVGDKAGAIAQWQKAAEIIPSRKAQYDAEIARLQQP